MKSLLDIYIDAAWEAVRDNPSKEAYERHLHLNNAELDFSSGAIRTTQRVKPGPSMAGASDSRHKDLGVPSSASKRIRRSIPRNASFGFGSPRGPHVSGSRATAAREVLIWLPLPPAWAFPTLPLLSAPCSTTRMCLHHSDRANVRGVAAAITAWREMCSTFVTALAPTPLLLTPSYASLDCCH